METENIACASSDHMPNIETQEILGKIEKGEGLIKADDLEDLFKKLGI